MTLLSGCLLAVMLSVHPVPALIHERPEHLSIGLKGSFWEQGELAFFAGLFLLASLALRIEYALRPRSILPLSVVYGLALGSALASLNKTVWVALVCALMASALLYRGRGHGEAAARRWTGYLVLFAIACAVGLWAYNAWLPVDEKLVTGGMLEHKWENERGAALRIAWDLILQAPLLGHGFGFVEAYFGSHPSDVIGLGSGVAQLFNSYLDIWLSVGLPGLMYALGLLAAAFSRHSPVSLLIVVYLFVFASFNPVAQHEYYFLFLGIALAAARGETTHPDATQEAPWATR
jgi:O-antigen ligase